MVLREAEGMGRWAEPWTGGGAAGEAPQTSSRANNSRLQPRAALRACRARSQEARLSALNSPQHLHGHGDT